MTDMNWSIRPLERGDIAAIVAGEERAFGQSLGESMLLFDLDVNPFAHHFTLEVDGAVRGYISSWILDESHAQILDVYVDVELRGNGFGEALVSFVCDLCDASGISELTLEVRPSNAVARALYEKLGFTQEAVRKNYYTDTNEDALLYVRRREARS